MFNRYLAVVAVAFAPSLAFAQGLTAQAAEQEARAHLDRNQTRYGVTSSDLADLEVDKAYTSGGISHVYFRQRLNGLAVVGTEVGIHLDQRGHVFHETGRFAHALAARGASAAPALTAAAATDVVARDANLTPTEPFAVVDSKDGGRQLVLSDGGVALEAPTAELEYVLAENGLPQLAWAVNLYQQDAQHNWYTYVDAMSGAVLRRYDLVVHDTFGPTMEQQLAESAATVGPWLFEPAATFAPTAALVGSYKVYAMPVESPLHAGSVTTDMRTTAANPDVAGGSASPFGWHDTNGAAGPEHTITRGNNVSAYTDTDANNTPDAGSQPDGTASLTFDFPLDLSLAPSAYRPAAVVNLFYWNNIIHDVLYQYGFDEASGNFQSNNYGNGGSGNDFVLAEAQDGSGTNNANFNTPTDGQSGRMQMYTWSAPTPDRDGDFDAGIVLHEYGHGVSNRLTGNAVTCLQNSEQMGEGWSDYMTLMFTMLPTMTRTTSHGVGNYALAQALNGPGIRPAPYNTNFAVNDFTYQDTRTAAVPHGVGFIWATILNEMTWDLIDAHGFSPDFYNESGTAGNQIALRLVMEGMKLQPCSPGFVDGRDAIIAADVALYGGVHVDQLWESFAIRGLGFGASQGSSNSNADNTEAFNTPEAVPPAGITNLTAVPQGDFATLNFTAVGDDGPVGTATTYDARRATGAGCPIATDAAFNAATPITGEPAPQVAGSSESIVASGLSFTTAYCFAIKVADESGNLSPLSNNASTTTLGAPVLVPPAQNPITASVASGGTTTVPVTLGNTGASTLTYSVSLAEARRPAPGGATGGTETAFAPEPAETAAMKDQPETPGAPASFGAGGPDTFGYRWIDSDEPGGPAFSWVDIAATGTSVTLSDDGETNLTLPFSFEYYGVPYTSLRLSSNGAMSFTETGDITFTNGTIPAAAAPNGLLAPFWDDLDPSAGGNIYYRNMGDGRFVISWVNVPHYGTTTVGTYTFQVIINASGAITYQYQTMVGAVNSATVGFENQTGTDGLQMVNNAAYVHNGLAVRIASLWVDAQVTTPTVPAGGTDSFDLVFDAAGLADGSYSANMTITTNDPTQATTVVPIVFNVGAVAGQDGPAAFEGTHLLSAVRPNPITSAASFTLAVRDAGAVSIALYDALGRRVATLFDGEIAAGAARTFAVDAAGLASGAYVLRVEGPGFAESRRVTLAR